MLNALPAGPMRFSLGTWQLSRKIEPVSDVGIPSLCFCCWLEYPSKFFSTMNAHIPSRLPFGYAKMTATFALLPFEFQALLPFSMKLFPFSSNVVRRDAGSLPAVGSVSPKHMTFSPRVAGGRYRCFCSSLAHFWTVTCPSETWPERNVRTPVP